MTEHMFVIKNRKSQSISCRKSTVCTTIRKYRFSRLVHWFGSLHQTALLSKMILFVPCATILSRKHLFVNIKRKHLFVFSFQCPSFLPLHLSSLFDSIFVSTPFPIRQFDTIPHSTPIAHALKTTKIRIKKNPAEAGFPYHNQSIPSYKHKMQSVFHRQAMQSPPTSQQKHR
jgi:hypothetical protein